MKIISMIPVDKRDEFRCHFCNETRSVKYIVEAFDPIIDAHKPSQLNCCNKCAFIGGITYDTKKLNWRKEVST